MMRKLYILFVCGSLGSIAQQLPQYSQYMLNQMAINPAVAGTDDYSEVRSNSRQQWVGITDAPRTFILNLQGPIRGKNMGLGMNVYTDIVGPTRRTGIGFTYAYNIKVKDDINLSMGLNAGVMQWGIDGSKITLHDEGDQHLLTSYRTAPVPDIGAGLYLYKKHSYYFGISMPQLYQSPILIYPGSSKESKLVSQININAGYTYTINEEFSVEPSFLIKYEKPAPVKYDIGARAIYQNQIWLGVVYRHMDAVSALLGYMYKDYLIIGYSYDFTTTRLKNYSSGTHEILLGLRFSKKQAATWNSRTEP